MKEEAVSIAEFKRHMGVYMQRIRGGGTVVLLNRDQPTARVTCVDPEPQGRLLAVPPRQDPETFRKPRRIRVRSQTTSLDALLADRAER